MHKGFADLSLSHLGTAPCNDAAVIITKERREIGVGNGFPWQRATFFSRSQGKSSDSASHRRTRYFYYMPIRKSTQAPAQAEKMAESVWSFVQRK
jgi:hypothetical protein